MKYHLIMAWAWLALLIFGFLTCSEKVLASHFVYLPLIPDTPIMQSEIQTQEVKFCLNSTAQNYPQFASQVDDVNANITQSVGTRFAKVAFGTPTTTGCQLQHNMLSFECGGCAAHVFYANWPVIIEYKVEMGFSDWRSAIGHEISHALLGLHEQYNDSGGSIGCTYRADTVMSCGPPYVRYPQPLDVQRGCAVIKTSWCGVQQPPPAECATSGWDECSQRWRFPDGLSWSPAPAPYGVWYKDDVSIFDGCDLSWGGRHSKAAQGWQRQGSFFFFDALNFGMETPIC